MASDVFISHSSTDKQVADSICAFLETNGFSCWIAPRNILPGEEWGDSILRGIQECRVMVLVFSKAANDSGPVRSEVDRASNSRKILIPFRIENVAPTGAMEFHIGRRHWLEAYTPPLERHQDLLLRAVRDILKPAATGVLPVPTGSTTFSQATAATLPATSTTPLPLTIPDDVPLRALLNMNHVVVAGHPSTFQVLIENRCASVLQQVEILVESRGLERPATKTLARLAPGQSQRHLFEIEPIRTGNFVLQCTIKCQEDMKQIALVGSRSLRINEAPSTSHMAFSDLKASSATNTVGGASPLSGMTAAGEIRTLNDLLNLELPENFEPLDLSLDYEVSMRALAQEEASGGHRLQIPGTYLHQAQEGTVLKLENLAASGTGSSATKEIRLVARPSFCLGRSREEADYVTWFWPRNEANDHKTRRLSKRHCILELKGNQIVAHDNETSNHSSLGGEELDARDGEPLERRGVLKLAETYFVDVTPFPSNAPEGPAIGNLRNWSGPKAVIAPTVRGCVRFIPMTPSVLPQNSTWLLTDGTFGTSRANPIILDLGGLAEIQGRFYHHLGGFWIESSATNGAVQVIGARVDPGFIVPLVTGQTVKLGAATFRVSVSA